MSMDFSEFLRRLGADPQDQDPEFLRARASGEEFERAASEAERFEQRLQQAVQMPAPDDLLDQIRNISSESTSQSRSGHWRRFAVAAALFVAVGAAGITWNLNRGWDSVDEYVMDHYRHDGEMALQQAGKASTGDVQAFFAQYDMAATPGLAAVISVIKSCPTPDGKGVHMVLNTEGGPVTVIYMPETGVVDHQSVDFDDVNALYVSLQKGSAIIIGKPGETSSLYSLVQRSIIPAISKA